MLNSLVSADNKS